MCLRQPSRSRGMKSSPLRRTPTPTLPVDEETLRVSVDGEGAGRRDIGRFVFTNWSLIREHGDTFERDLLNGVQNVLCPVAYVMILEAHDEDASFCEYRVSLRIPSGIVVRAVELDRELGSRAIEVDDERADRMLPSNRNPELVVTHELPKRLLFRSAFLAKSACSLEHVLRCETCLPHTEYPKHA